MQTVRIAGYKLHLYGKQDGNFFTPNHPACEKFCSIQQQHTDTIQFLTAPTPGHKKDISGDAIVTSRDKHVGTYVSDCVPIAVLGQNHYAVIHGSRKTLSQGILQKTVQILCRQGEGEVDMHVYLGPSIRVGSYQVGEEFIDYFDSDYLLETETGLYLDMKKYITSRLVSRGFLQHHIVVHPHCTSEYNHLYWSYRAGERDVGNFMGVAAVDF